MDKKHLFLGIACIVAAFGLMISEGHRVAVSATSVVKQMEEAPATSVEAPLMKVPQPVRYEIADTGRTFVLKNDYITVDIAEVGGGIRTVALEKYPRTQDSKEPWIFNDYDEEDALTLQLQMSGEVMDLRHLKMKVVEKTANRLVLQGNLPNGVVVERAYQIAENNSKDEPYLIHHQARILNQGEEVLPLQNLNVSIGSFPPTLSDIDGFYLNFGYYNGKKAKFIKLNEFKASNGLFGWGKHSERDQISSKENLVWGAVKNQFFTAILTPDATATGYEAAPIHVDLDDNGLPESGIQGGLTLPVKFLAKGQSQTIGMSYYVGPKEYTRLDRLGQHQDLVMQFGWFGFISKLLLLLMTGIHAIIPNWGMTIILLTLAVKLALWPLTNAQVRSTRGMAKIQKPLKEIQEKYRNNPKKVQMETMRLFKENEVNPAAGCLPIFIQLPIIMGLYYMIRTASELRFASFLWISDLSIADTVGYLGSFPINPLPLLMGITMVWQMHMTPNTAQGSQKLILKWMPLLFVFLFYRVSSGLVLYWTVNNLVTILQTYWINRKMKEQEAAEKSSRERENARGTKKNFSKKH